MYHLVEHPHRNLYESQDEQIAVKKFMMRQCANVL